MTDLQRVHRWLVSEGFNRDTKETLHCVYSGVLHCNQVEVPIRFSFDDLSFEELPEVHLSDPKPECLAKPLPHIDHNNKLCYLDAESYRIDPYQPLQTIVNLLDLARRALIESISGVNAEHVGYEFRAYWEPASFGVVLSHQQSGGFAKYNHVKYTGPTGTKHWQLVVGSDDEIDRYTQLRMASIVYGRHKNVIWITVKTNALLPEKEPWPPSNFFDFYKWLKSVDITAAKTLHHCLGTKAGTDSHLLIVLQTPGGFVGIEVILPKGLLTLTKHSGRFRKHLLTDTGKFDTKFIRAYLDDYTAKYQATRNLTGKGLAGKRIVLIGCGTVGGYLARLLVSTGAGLNSGYLEMYDDQILVSGNLGRHYLDGQYYRENKAAGCHHKLSSEFPSANIKYKPKKLNSLMEVRYADLVIDATGRELFSLALNSQAIKQKKFGEPCPDILYAWVDGNGFCGSTLLYDGTGGCYRCLQDLSGKNRFEPLQKEHELTPVSYKCGESFVPYPPSGPVQTAGMALEAILDWVNGSQGFHFRTRQFHEKARKHKNQNLTITQGCPACQS